MSTVASYSSSCLIQAFQTKLNFDFLIDAYDVIRIHRKISWSDAMEVHSIFIDEPEKLDLFKQIYSQNYFLSNGTF